MTLELHISGEVVAREQITYNTYEVVRAIMDDLISRHVRQNEGYEFYMIIPSRMQQMRNLEGDLTEQ